MRKVASDEFSVPPLTLKATQPLSEVKVPMHCGESGSRLGGGLHGVHRRAAVLVPQIDGFGHDGVGVLLRYLGGRFLVRV